MNDRNRRKLAAAVRAFNRLMAPKIEEYNIGSAADRLYDGGEWSDPHWGSWIEDQEVEIAKLVGEKFGVEPSEVVAYSSHPEAFNGE